MAAKNADGTFLSAYDVKAETLLAMYCFLPLPRQSLMLTSGRYPQAWWLGDGFRHTLQAILESIATSHLHG